MESMDENQTGSRLESDGDLIGSGTSVESVINALARHGCPDLTPLVNLTTCSDFPLAGGGFCDVYRGVMTEGTRIAIKCLRIYDQPGREKDKQKILKRAAREMYHWSKLKHPNILPLKGLAMFRGHLSMISEWMENRNLTSYIASNPHVNRIGLCLDVCLGLAYIHANKMAHGDLKAANVLVSSIGTAMITDFGSSQLKELTLKFTNTTNTGFSIRWTAPELLDDNTSHDPSEKTDVYAYGMTVLEILTGKVPYDELTDQQVMIAVFVNHKTPDFPATGVSHEFWGILQRCWCRDGSKRPRMSSVAQQLQVLVVREHNGIAGASESPSKNARRANIRIRAHSPGISSPAPRKAISVPASNHPPISSKSEAPNLRIKPARSYGSLASQPAQRIYPQGYYPTYGFYPRPQLAPGRDLTPGTQTGFVPSPLKGIYPERPVAQPQFQAPLMQYTDRANPQLQQYMHTQTQTSHPPQPIHPTHIYMPQNDPRLVHQYIQPYAHQYTEYTHQPVPTSTLPDGPSNDRSSQLAQFIGEIWNETGNSGSNRHTKDPEPQAPVILRRLSPASVWASRVYHSKIPPAEDDEAASIASSSSSSTSSSSRWTNASASGASNRPAVPRPDWSIGLLPEPSLSHVTSTSSNDSLLVVPTPRLPSGKQIPGTGVKFEADFPPLGEKGGSTPNAKPNFPPLNKNTNPSPSNGNKSFPRANGNGSGNARSHEGVWQKGSVARLFGNKESKPFKPPPPTSKS